MTAPSRTPVLFVHGLWLHGTSWGPWMDIFREAGYEQHALLKDYYAVGDSLVVFRKEL